MIKKKRVRASLSICITMVFIMSTAYVIEAKQDLSNVRDYFPIKEMVLKYTGGFENSGYTLTVEEIKEDRMLMVQQDAGTTVNKVYKVLPEEITLIYIKEGNMQYTDLSKVEPNCEEVILKLPLVEGNKWSSNDGKDFEITGINKRIITPCGVYNTVEVTSKWSSLEYKYYYAIGVGLIKIVERNKDDYHTVSEIEKVHKK
jgi:hypothetical protein